MAMSVAHAAPATPMSKPKMKIGSRMRFVPKPTIMHVIDFSAAPSARWSAERPKAMCEKMLDARTIFK